MIKYNGKFFYKLISGKYLDKNGKIKEEYKLKLNFPEFGIVDSKITANLFLPEGEGRKGEGGLRTKGYFKFSYKLVDNKWYFCDFYGNSIKPVDEELEKKTNEYIETSNIDLKELPLITVITVVYNGEKYLEETIQSVINQTYPNVEYIIIDGGSTDGTLDIIKKYEDYIDYWISEPDNGLYDAMNKGIKLSLGKYLIFMNAGDRFAKSNTLKKVKEQIEKNSNPDFVYGDALEEDINGNLFLKKAYSHKYIWYGMFTHHQSMFYKLDIINKHKLRYRLEYKIAADYAFTYEYLKYTNKVLRLNFPICIFLQGGLSSVSYQKGLSEANLIRREIGNLNPLQTFIISSIHQLKHILRNKVYPAYKFFRYKKVL